MPPTETIAEARILIQNKIKDNPEMNEFIYEMIMKICGEASNHESTPCYSISS